MPPTAFRGRIDHKGQECPGIRDGNAGAVDRLGAGGRVFPVGDPVEHPCGDIGHAVAGQVERADRAILVYLGLEGAVTVQVHVDCIVRAADGLVGDQHGRIVKRAVGMVAQVVAAGQTGVGGGAHVGRAQEVGEGELAAAGDRLRSVDVPAPVDGP